MKNRLIILSDLWGREKSAWINNYTKILGAYFQIHYYDCCELGSIDKSTYTEEELHRQFVEGGIEKAVQKLIALEKDAIHILAFSIGGTIAWKYGLATSNINSLFCVSTTRLRYETITPQGQITLFYGDDDTYKPNQKWFDEMQVEYHILNHTDHQLYQEAEFSKRLCEYIFNKI